ncbi:LLM class flavin-dependent oxidoreductase [Chelatococcus reniformis]|uniref:N5,N10-methylene tetrahydromethanopterin reductase n=1 Tax=Chelatococcus reniformis TaxID=1494448 RepID=A0A916UA42_9HYPH|nr:LLM class flavin-dependent oxidoreductase [Chelatococcus reniformis]GGC65470.1 N5,N10-methylene tetrahydromethanopterin reductase [Chelatococcus reniformis]
MPKQIRVNGFAIHAPVHLSPGLWTHPRDRSLEFNTLDYWIDVARIMERGKFDALFIADGIGIHDIYGGNADVALRSGVQVPKYDPMLLVSALANATEHLGFGITASVSYEPPFTLARRFSTLDHLTGGRIAWNVVTGYSAAASRAVGRPGINAHDLRYDIADEFLEAVYKLWEGSWEDGAVLRDKVGRAFADPSKIHRIEHRGEHFQFEAIHLVDPSPQRTPFLFQAGASNRGREFAASHAEAVFLGDSSKAAAAATVADIRRRATARGRDPYDIRFYGLITVIVGATEAEAQAKLADYLGYVDHEGALALFSGWTGIDLSAYALDDPFPIIRKDNAVTSMIDAFAHSEKAWTIREVIEHTTIGGRGPLAIGSPEQVADELQAWVAETDIDGFNLSYAITPDGYADFVDLVVPELQRRGVYPTDYAPGTLREKVFGKAARLPEAHPAARQRVQPAAAARVTAPA